MSVLQPPGVIWVRARRCYATHQCVELARMGDLVLIRDSKHPEVELHYTPAEIEAFLDGAKRGEFDHLVASHES